MNDEKGAKTQSKNVYSKVEKRCCQNPCSLCKQVIQKLLGGSSKPEKAEKKAEGTPSSDKDGKSKGKKKKQHNMDTATDQENMSALFRMMRDYYAVKLSAKYWEEPHARERSSPAKEMGAAAPPPGAAAPPPGAAVTDSTAPEDGDAVDAEGQPIMAARGSDEDAESDEEEEEKEKARNLEHLYDQNVVVPGSTGSLTKEDFPPPIPNDSLKKTTTYSISSEDEVEMDDEDDDEDENWKKWQEQKKA